MDLSRESESDEESISSSSEDEAELSEESKTSDSATKHAAMPKSNITKPNEIEDRQTQKRIEDLENLYAMLPDQEPDIVEMHYDQFEGDTIKTYNYLSRGLNQYQGDQPRVMVIDARGFQSVPHNHYDEDVVRLNDLISGGNNLQSEKKREKEEIRKANIDPEEKKMITKALDENYKKERKEMKKKKVGKAKKHGW